MAGLFPPFAPDGGEPPRRGLKSVPVRVLVPNVITLVALCIGLSAIRLGIEGKLDLAVLCVLAAAILDGVDGRVARLLKGTSRFGAELDSLADFVNFGVAPALLVYTFALDGLRSVGWIVALVFAVAAALRLARFNVMLDDPDRPEWMKNYFVGIPAPAGALCALLPVYLHLLGVPARDFPGMISIFMLFIAFMMVSRIPTWSGKTLGQRIPRERVLPLFVACVLAAGVLASYTFETLTVMTLAYLLLIPVGVAAFRRNLQRHGAAPAGAATAQPEAAGETPEQGGAGPAGGAPPAA
ncbi:CDP-diacylglycerol--serine O-phosphatidyltransferase [Camelimonas abortus]|uniref:CDP-diacylglycerol--serine O-phosphatidyltransferase n=1 Tax=Camelimonas abortus TaxID=1017184 RepID=A0ABV7LFE4_9HYPH